MPQRQSQNVDAKDPPAEAKAEGEKPAMTPPKKGEKCPLCGQVM
jgi:hypothetical protein